jgi:vancomycin resistance protein VanJ
MAGGGREEGRRRREVVVPCGGNAHRVRLAGGLRFWASARCPICRAPVDRTRLRRVARGVANLARPASAGWPHRMAWGGSLLFLLGIVAAVVLVQRYGDRWWPGTILLFGPRWLLALPLLVLVPAAIRLDRALLAPLALAVLLIPGPLLGWRMGWRALFVGPDPSRDLTVATLNAESGRGLHTHPVVFLQDWRADIAVFQECGDALRAQLEELTASWHIHASSGLCIASRYPVTEVREMDREALAFADGAGWVFTYGIEVDGHELRVTNLHLETPRAGLQDLQVRRFRRGLIRLRERTHVREVEFRQARRWVDGQGGPHLVMGDFNSPPESQLLRQYWGSWQNTFSRVGRGVGASRVEGLIRARIDHILADGSWTVVRARVAEDVGSDHLPVVATVRLREGWAAATRPAPP